MDKYRVRIVYKGSSDTVVITDFDSQTREPNDISNYLWGVARKWSHHAINGTKQPAPFDYLINQGPSVGDYILVSDNENNRAWYRINDLDNWSYTVSYEDPDLAQAYGITT